MHTLVEPRDGLQMLLQVLLQAPYVYLSVQHVVHARPFLQCIAMAGHCNETCNAHLFASCPARTMAATLQCCTQRSPAGEVYGCGFAMVGAYAPQQVHKHCWEACDAALDIATVAAMQHTNVYLYCNDATLPPDSAMVPASQPTCLLFITPPGFSLFTC